MEGLAEYYSAELSQKIKRGLHENRSKGLFPGGRIAYGYRVENKRVLIDEERAKIVLYVFQQYAQGVIAKDIIADLTEKGVTYHGKPFALNTLYGMLRLRKYIGICNCAGTDYDNIYPPIVPTALFDEVGRILEKNKIGSKSREVEFLLKGKLICGYCGKSLQGDSGTSKNGTVKYYYKCMGRKKMNICEKDIMPKEKLEQAILDATMQVFGTPDGISAIADEIIKIHEKRMHDRSVLTILMNERDAIKKSLANIMKAIEQGILNATTKSRMDELEAQLSEVEDKIVVEQYKAQNQLKKEEVVEYLTHTIKQQPKLLIKNLIQKIVLYDDRFEIYYNYLNHMPPAEDDPDKTIRELSLSGCSDTSPLCPPTWKSDEHWVTGSSDFFFCHPKSPFDTTFDTNIICSGTTLDIILFLAVDYAERTIPFFLRTARAIALTNSTIGIMENASAMAMAYSVPSSFARSKASASGLTSTTRVVSSNESMPAPQSHQLRFLILKTEPCKERILNAWKISAIESVRNAIDEPSISALYAPFAIASAWCIFARASAPMK